MAATAKNSITTNTYWRYTVVLTETSTNAINNTSAVTAKVYIGRTGNASYITGADISGSVTIDGTKKTYHYTKSGRVDVAVGDTSLLIATLTFTVDHDSDGEKVATWSSEFDNNVSGANPSGGSFSGKTITLTDIDRSAPTITFTAGTITANSFKISASSTYTCDTWQYSINGGTSYTTFSTASGTSKTYTVTGLSPATSYSVKVRATRTHNDVRGTSSAKTVKTIGNSLINSAGTIQLDSPSGATGTLNMTIYVSSYKHKLEMYVADTLVYAVSDIVKPTGAQTYTFTIPSSTLSTIYGLMPNSASATATYKLYSYDGSTQIGNVSSKSGTIKLSQSYSAPTFDNTPNYTFSDTNANTANLTGNNQLMVQRYSNLSVVASSATAKNGASIASYSVAINGVTVSSNTTAVSFGTVNVSGDVTVSVSATDSRGFTTTATGLITVIPYEDVRIDDLTFARVNNFEEYCDIALDGYFSAIEVNGTAKNTITSLRYRKKKTTDTAWGSWVAIFPTVNVSLFSYDNDNFETLDRNFAWDFQFEVSDELSSYTISALILEGIPTMSLRKNMVGINNPNPQSALDINGSIRYTETDLENYTIASDAELDALLIEQINAMGTYKHKAFSIFFSNTDNVTSSNAGYYVELYARSTARVLIYMSSYVSSGRELRRVYNDSGLGEWEWRNPNCSVGKEYRSTERFNGYAVYYQLFDLGAAPTEAGGKTVAHGIKGCRPISVESRLTSAVYTVPYTTTSGGRIMIGANSVNIVVYASYAVSSPGNVQALLKYYKV